MSSKKNQGGDERFARVQRDPRFWEMPERERKVKIDKRFQSMFHEKRFQVKSTVDKRGRPINHTSSEDLRRFYKLDSEDEEDVEREEVTERGKKVKLVKGEREAVQSKEDEDEESEDEGERMIFIH
nr:PREDICTED: ESF1 homolog [Paralichthys olivaceus]